MKKVILSILLITFFSCGEKGPEKPERLLSEEQMENILYDLILIQTVSSTSPRQIKQNDIDVKNYVYNKHGIDSLTLVQNQKFYAADIEKYQGMHKKIAERLKAEKTPLDSITSKPSGKKLIRKGATIPSVQ
jgi:hypothetical protein